MGTRLFSSCLGLLLLTLSAKGDDTAGYVQFNTSVGIINVRLLAEAPLNVANFLSYVNSGAYNRLAGSPVHTRLRFSRRRL